MRKSIALSAAVLALFTSTSFAGSLFDFGGGSSGNVNNVPANATSVVNAIDTDGVSTGIDLTLVSSPGWGTVSNSNGTESPGTPADTFFTAEQTSNSLFGFDTFSGDPRPLQEYLITGLAAGAGYDFTFFASREGVGDNRETLYDISGTSATLNASNNTSNVAQIIGVVANGLGEFTLTVTKGLNNDNGSGFYYLGAMLMEASSSQSPCDFDNSGSCDGVDVDALVAEIVAMTNGALFDLNGDTNVDGADLIEWLADAGAENLASGNSYLLGDANLDGSVNGGDFLAWNDNKFTAVAAWTAGDFNADGNVNGGDFLIWNDNKFTSADAIAIPEPSGLVWLSIMFAWTFLRPVRR